MRRICRGSRRRQQYHPALWRFVTPNDLKLAGVRLCQGWWVSKSSGLALPVGAVSLDEVSINALSAWSQSNLQNWAAGHTDPDGGSGAYKIQDTVDGGGTSHYSQGTVSALVGTIHSFDIWLEPDQKDWFLVASGNTPLGLCYYNATTGAVGYTAECTGTDLGADGAGRWLRVTRTSQFSSNLLRVYPSDGGNNADHVYTGAGDICGYCYGPDLIQPRAALVADVSLDNDGTPRGADASNGTDAEQPGFGAPWTLVNSLPALMGEDGRATKLAVTHADDIALGSGDDPQAGFMAVASVEDGGRLFEFVGSGSIAQYLDRSGNDLRLTRHDGASSDTQTFGSGLGTLLDAANSVALFGIGSRQWALYIGGTYRATVTMGDLSSANATAYYPISSTGTGSVIVAESSAFSDLVSLGGHAAIYAALKAQAGLDAMADRWGVSA